MSIHRKASSGSVEVMVNLESLSLINVPWKFESNGDFTTRNNFHYIWIAREKLSVKCVPVANPESWLSHDDVIKWKNFPLYWPFVRKIHRLPVNSPHKGQWRFDVFFGLGLNKRLSKQWSGWWFKTPSRSLWRHSNLMASHGCSKNKYHSESLIKITS